MKLFPKLHTWREWRFELASLQSNSFSTIKKKKKRQVQTDIHNWKKNVNILEKCIDGFLCGL